MSARRHGRTLGIALALTTALALGGCDSSDDDGGGEPGGSGNGDGPAPGPGPGEESATATTFAEIIALGASDDPVDLDAEALGTDLERLFGTAGDEPTAIEDGDTIDTLGKRKGSSR